MFGMPKALLFWRKRPSAAASSQHCLALASDMEKLFKTKKKARTDPYSDITKLKHQQPLQQSGHKTRSPCFG